MAVNSVSSSSAAAPRKNAASKIPAPYSQYTSEVLAAAKRYRLPPSVLFGVMMRESGGRNIRGDYGHGRGLMQIDDRSHGAFLASHQGGMDPASNIMYAAKVLRESMDAFGGDLRKGLAAYNAGVGGVQAALRAGRSPDSATTGGDYSAAVLKNAEKFKGALGGASAAAPSSSGGNSADRASQTAGAARARRSTDRVSAHSLLKLGSRGAEVKELQRRLSEAGFQVPSSGVFDSRTDRAVRAYQRAKGLQVDGLVGQQTWGSFFGQSYPPGVNMLRGASSGGGSLSTPSVGGAGGAGGSGGASRPGAADDVGRGDRSAVEKMLALARSKLGFREGAGNSNPFSSAMGRPAEAWCADFVSYLAKKAGLSTVNTASAQGIQDQLAAKGRWKGLRNPQPGDAVTFNWSGSRGWADHVGIVERVFQKNGVTYVQTIEGNSGDMVRRKTYPANSSVIKGYGTIA